MPKPTGKQLVALYQYIEQGSYQAAAKVLGISKQAVHARIYRLRTTNPNFFNQNIDKTTKKNRPKTVSYDPKMADSQIVRKF